MENNGEKNTATNLRLTSLVFMSANGFYVKSESVQQ